MIYFLLALTLFMLMALRDASRRIKRAEQHIEIIRAALDSHLRTGKDYRSLTTAQTVLLAQPLSQPIKLRATPDGDARGDV